MSDDGSLLIFLGLLCLLGVIFWANGRFRRLENEVRFLRQELRKRDSAEVIAKPVLPQPPPPLVEKVWASPSDPIIHEVAQPTAQAEAMAALRTPITPAGRAAGQQDFERTFTTRWLVWLGGITIAIGGLFLARFAVEHGILGPGPRMLLSGLFGLLLILGGEVLSRRGWDRPVGFITPDQVPVALVAAGLSILFAAIYASHALHGLVSPGVTFGLLAATSLLGFPLAFRHGPFVGLLAYTGGLLLPILIRDGEPAGLGDAAWVAVLLLAVFFVAARLGMAWLLTAGVACHGVLTLYLGSDLEPQTAGSLAVWVVMLLILLPSVALLALSRIKGVQPALLDQACMAAALLALANLLILVTTSGFTSAVWVALLLLPALFAGLSRSDGMRSWLWPIGAILLVCVGAYALISLSRPPEAGAFVPLLAVILSYLAVSFVGALRQDRPIIPVLAAISVPVILAYLALLLWWLDRKVTLHLPWVLLLLAVVGLVLTIPGVRRSWAARARQPERAEAALAYYGAMSLPLLAILLAFWFEGAAMTLAIAMLVPLGVMAARLLGASALMHAAALMGSIVLGRFLMNGNVLDYPLNGPLHWPLWAMGGAALAHYIAARLMKAPGGPDFHGRTALADALLISALTLAISAVTLEIRAWTNGSLRADNFDLLEISLRTLAWMTAGLAALLPGRRLPIRIFGAILSGLALLQLAIFHLLALNPLWIDVSVGTWPLLNLLTLAYLLPALLLIYAHRPILSRLPVRQAIFDPLILLLLLTYAGLSVRQAFHGDVISLDVAGMPSDWELNCYSGLGLVSALLLILLGIRTGRADVRNTAMAILLLTVAKVFLLDMSGLSGVPRILSFLGLGLSLIGVGWIYQRFVFPRPTPSPQTDHTTGQNS